MTAAAAHLRGSLRVRDGSATECLGAGFTTGLLRYRTGWEPPPGPARHSLITTSAKGGRFKYSPTCTLARTTEGLTVTDVADGRSMTTAVDGAGHSYGEEEIFSDEEVARQFRTDLQRMREHGRPLTLASGGEPTAVMEVKAPA